MEEKVLIKSEQYDVKKLSRMIVLVSTIVTAIGLVLILMLNPSILPSAIAYWHHGIGFFLSFPYRYFETQTVACWFFACHLLAYGFIACLLIAALLYFWLRSYKLTVTNKRIYGKVAWGKRVDLPVDSISATATIQLFKGVSVSTSSGRISFLVIKNADEIYKVMNDLLIERQQEKTNAAAVSVPGRSNETDQLKKYKDLLDDGAISQEEFDAKKKQLLGL